ncbi:MAG: hypothetical protein IPF75_18400 [Bacteroidetes bacterium]|nr:hypothetical protein [Bacteroidota bacterium]
MARLIHYIDKTRGKILVVGFAKLTIFEGNETAEDRFIVKIQGAKPIEKKSLYESTGKSSYLTTLVIMLKFLKNFK